MTRHLVEPVRFRPMVEAMYEAGARVFVQPGIGNLTGFVDDILDGAAARRHPGGHGEAHRAGPAPPRPRGPVGRRGREHVPAPAQAAAPPPRLRRPRGATRVRAPGPALSDGCAHPESGAGAPSPHRRRAVADPAAIHPVWRRPPRSSTTPRRPRRTSSPPGPPPPPVPSPRLVPALPGVRGGVATPAGGPPGRRPRPPPVPPHRHRPRPPAPAPPAGGERPEGQWPTGRFTITYRASLDRMPYMLDHTLYRQPPDWPDDSDRSPSWP